MSYGLGVHKAMVFVEAGASVYTLDSPSRSGYCRDCSVLQHKGNLVDKGVKASPDALQSPGKFRSLYYENALQCPFWLDCTKIVAARYTFSLMLWKLNQVRMADMSYGGILENSSQSISSLPTPDAGKV